MQNYYFFVNKLTLYKLTPVVSIKKKVASYDK